MSIRDRTNFRRGTATSVNRALELFTDRNEFTYLFARYLNEEPVREQILFFHGAGGNGKTLLLEYLRKKCCKHFVSDTWQEIMAKSEAEAAQAIANIADENKFQPIPAIIHDFGMSPIGDERPQDPFYGLLMLRRNIARVAKNLRYRLRFPLFDFASFWYLHSIGKSKEEIKGLFPSDEVGLIAQLIDGITGIPWVSLATASFEIIAKYAGWEEKLKQRGINSEKVREIQAMEPEKELIYHLPEYLAEDLNAAMAEEKAPPRLVLFFDTHEKFWGSNRNLQGIRLYELDEWLRNFLTALELSQGILVVVAGRDRPKWEEATKYDIPTEYTDTWLVGHLSAADARTYLQRAGIRGEKLATAIIDYASVSPNQVHPFLLGLCVDVVESAKHKKVLLAPEDFSSRAVAEKKPRELIERLLQYVNRNIERAVRALSASRAFNYQVYQRLGQKLNFAAMEADFEVLSEFSFVWQDDKRGEDWYRIHDLLRRLDRENPQEITKRAHEALEAYWREQGDITEAIYHANCLDWEKGLEEWLEVFDFALQYSYYEPCRSLLELRSELQIDSDEWLGLISYSEGKYFAQLAQHTEAAREFLEAIAAYDRALALAPDDNYTLNNKGLALQNLGKLQAGLTQHQEALNSYQEAIAAYERALALAPDQNYTLNNKGLALKALGDLQAGLTQHQEALISYQEAIAAYERALALAPDYINALNNKGIALQALGDLQAGLTQHQEALISYQEAIAAYERALALAPDYINALNNKGNALQNLGKLQAGLTQHQQALNSYQEAIAAYERALALAPDDNYTLNNKGNALQNLGKLQAGLTQHQQALNSYQEAIAAYERALALAPDNISALNNKGLALINLGNLHAELSREQEAMTNWQAALEAFSQSLNIAPNDNIQNLRDELSAFLNRETNRFSSQAQEET